MEGLGSPGRHKYRFHSDVPPPDSEFSFLDPRTLYYVQLRKLLNNAGLYLID